MENKNNFLPRNLLPLVIIAVVLACLEGAPEAWAHRLNVFAEVTGDKVRVQAGFGKSRPARNAEVTVFSREQVLLKARTDDKGICEFEIPPQVREKGLTVQVNAGQGHMNKWTLEKEDVSPSGVHTIPEAKITDSKANDAFVTEGEIRQIVREELERAAQYAKKAGGMEEPGLTEIIGGIGWIIGLAGIFLWYRSVAKNRN